MTPHVPSWMALLLLTLGLLRTVRLVGWDDITTIPRRWVTGLGDDEHAQYAYVVDKLAMHGIDAWRVKRDVDAWDVAAPGEELPPLVKARGRLAPPVGKARMYASRMLRCPWCLGFHLSVVFVVVWWCWPREVLLVMVPLAVSEAAGLLSKWDRA